MDRNISLIPLITLLIVALRKESVDRNVLLANGVGLLNWSLSARRAWIEIQFQNVCVHWFSVALRKESVDRNTSIDNLTQGVFKSLSARRAWIEMRKITITVDEGTLSLSARRAWIEISLWVCLVGFAFCRSPQGERG